MLLALLLTALAQTPAPPKTLHVVVRPTNPDQESAAGLRLVVWLSCSGETHSRTEIRTGEHGRSEIDLALPPEASGNNGTLFAHAELLEPGWQHFDQLAGADLARNQAEITNFAYLRGGTLTGHVDAGAANTNTQVELFLVREGEPPATLGLRPSWDRVVARASQPFRVHFKDAGRYRLLARAEGLGSACVEDLSLVPGEDLPPAFELHLTGPGVIEGRFLDPEGTPHRRHPLWATPRALAEGEEVRNAEFRCAPSDERGDGVRWCACETDSDGRFRLAGLAPGAYWIYSGYPRTGGRDALCASPIGTGAREITLVGGTPVLELHVIDADGKDAQVRRNRPDIDDRDSGMLLCVRCPAGTRPSFGINVPDTPLSNPHAPARVFLVERGERYVYAYVRPGFAPIAGEITIAPSTFRSARELRVEPAAASGELKLELTRPDGAPLARDFQVTLESLSNGLPLFFSKRDTSGSSWHDTFPPGRYRVRIATSDSTPLCGTGWVPAPAPFGDWTAPVEIRSGATTQLGVRMWRGGKLHLALVPSPGSPTPARWPARFPTRSFPPESDWLQLGARGPAATVTLRPDPEGLAFERETGAPEPGAPVEFLSSGLNASYHFPALLPGDEETSADWIPPGDYILRVESRDFAPAEAKLSIRADETTNLRVELTSR
ncbi:MAG: hypothetical protein IPJ19_06835 [Planctomycetes bacterium]|nr:hypothetical protein [Planctomycetota bacterium]